MRNKIKKARKRDDVAQTVASITKKTPRYVNQVRNGDRENTVVETIAVEYQLGKNKLIRKLEEMISLIPKPEKYAREKN